MQKNFGGMKMSLREVEIEVLHKFNAHKSQRAKPWRVESFVSGVLRIEKI